MVVMDQLCRDVLVEHRQDIILSADENDVFLNRLIDHLLSKRCLAGHQREYIKGERISADRCGKLLDFVATEGHQAFLELCNAIERFDTVHKCKLADSLRTSLKMKQWTVSPVKLLHSSTGAKKRIWGMTVLNDELYVASGDGNDIVVYETNKFRIVHVIKIRHVGGVRDMTSCRRNCCVYIADWRNNVVHKLVNKYETTEWEVDDVLAGLAVNSLGNVLVTCPAVGKIVEFTSDGRLLREIKLSSDITKPWHTVELSDDQFVVCHGDENDSYNRVCVVNDFGELVQSFGGKIGRTREQLYLPHRLATNGFIFVADFGNNRILMLNSSMRYVRDLVSGLSLPCRVCVDEQTGRLYVGQNSGQWSVYALSC